ncbi:MAG: F0F1 ATP synthase subunit A, partial [Myxococcota bacterium]|nr:F0F1 ATP synthase subunit A [Myxococcota bacterium]
MNVFHAIENATGVPWFLWSALFAGVLLMATGAVVRQRLAAAQGGVVPDEGVSLRNLVEILVEFLAGLAEENMGPKWRRYFPLIGTLFFFILLSNLLGLVPGIDGATSDASVTWAWAIISFVLFQYVGIREHGWAYVNHFLGPALFDVTLFGRKFHFRPLAPLYAPIEIIGHVSRIFTLAVRLLANMFADHTVV